MFWRYICAGILSHLLLWEQSGDNFVFFLPEMMSDDFVSTWGDARPETEQPELLMPLFTKKYQIPTLVIFILGVFIITVESFLREKAKFWNITYRWDTHLSTIPPFPVAINLENVKF